MTTRTDWAATSVAVDETATSWTQLVAELRMLCRSLCYHTGWHPEGVTTFVRLPGDAEYAQALATVCRRLAREFRLTQSLVRDDDQWRVRFAHTAAARPSRTWPTASQPAAEEDMLRVVAVKTRAMLHRFATSWGYRRAGDAKY